MPFAPLFVVTDSTLLCLWEPACSLALIGFMIMHLRLCALNMTTIEAYEKRPIK